VRRGAAAGLALVLAFTAAGPAFADPAQARRVVDLVTVGAASSERDHEFSGEGVTTGSADGRTYREASGWQRYVLTVYDDSDVTLVCTFRGSNGQARRYVLEVEGTAVPVKPFQSTSLVPVDVEIRVPAALTRRRTMMAVTIRAVDGPTPAVMQLKTVQEHLEVW